MHLLPDLTPNTELALYCATILGLALVIARGSMAWHRHRIAVRHQYPDTWSDADIRILEQIRIAIGLALAMTWGFLLIAAPQMPSNAPFGLRPALALIFVLLLTGAWLGLVMPSVWKTTIVGRMKFRNAVGAVVMVWTILLGSTLFFIAKSAFSTAERPVHVIGTFA